MDSPLNHDQPQHFRLSSKVLAVRGGLSFEFEIQIVFRGGLTALAMLIKIKKASCSLEVYL